MTPHDFDDLESRLLAALPHYEPRPECTDRIRARCHAALLARRPKITQSTPVRSLGFTPELAAVSMLCAGFVIGVFRRALEIYGL